MSRLRQIIRDELIQSSYEIMTESINPDYHYEFEHSRRNAWKFKDRIGTDYFIILNQSLYKGDHITETKFGWIDSNNQKRYDKPPVYDERVFNTFIHIFLTEILPFYSQHYSEFYLEALDPLRFRLYRIALNKFLDKSKYTMEEKATENILIIHSNE